MSVLVHGCDPRLRADLVAAVRGAGYEAAELASLAELAAHPAAWDARVVILDLTDPECTRTIRDLRERAPGTGILAIGSRPGPSAAIEALRSGANGYLRKPFDVSSLERAVASAERSAARPARDAGLIADDSTSRRCLATLERTAASDATLLLSGESGVGKSRYARWLHEASPRRRAPFVSLECADLATAEAAALLYGRDIATGQTRVGRFEAAHGGTLVLEDVDALPREHQAAVLRVLQERRVLPLGAAAPVELDLRIVATTRRDLREEADAGRFRHDLLYRLDVIALAVPPLRERPGDVPPLARHFLERFAADEAQPIAQLEADGERELAARPFPGNVRELENLMRRAALLSAGAPIDVAAFDRPLGATAGTREEPLQGFDLRTLERDAIVRSLRATRGNRTAAARALGISVRTLRNKIQRYAL